MKNYFKREENTLYSPLIWVGIEFQLTEYSRKSYVLFIHLKSNYIYFKFINLSYSNCNCVIGTFRFIQVNFNE